MFLRQPEHFVALAGFFVGFKPYQGSAPGYLDVRVFDLQGFNRLHKPGRTAGNPDAVPDGNGPPVHLDHTNFNTGKIVRYLTDKFPRRFLDGFRRYRGFLEGFYFRFGSGPMGRLFYFRKFLPGRPGRPAFSTRGFRRSA